MKTSCCIVGGGPAGMILGFLLARAGVNVIVLEKHADFLRDFRGDTIHPSTLNVMDELGILDKFLERPHQELSELRGYIDGSRVTIADFSHVPGRCKFIAIMPQWDFLNFIAEEAKAYSGFQIEMETEATDLIKDKDRIVGVRTKKRDREIEVLADLTVAADGRHSILRKLAKLEPINLGAPMDVLWLRLSKKSNDPQQILGRVDRGHIFVMIDRGEYWQCGFVIHKGAFDEMRQNGLDIFREGITLMAPFLRDRVDEIKNWNDIKLLTVVVDRLQQWYAPGFLCIGDAAHAMSPIGGVGINLAIQDAVAAANVLAIPLRERILSLDHLRAIQHRREFPTRMTQGLQLFLQNRFVSRVLEEKETIRIPVVAKLLNRFPLLRRIPAWLIGIGFRPEHIGRALQNQNKT